LFLSWDPTMFPRLISNSWFKGSSHLSLLSTGTPGEHLWVWPLVQLLMSCNRQVQTQRPKGPEAPCWKSARAMTHCWIRMSFQMELLRMYEHFPPHTPCSSEQTGSQRPHVPQGPHGIVMEL
jgi:hypothetical protein